MFFCDDGDTQLMRLLVLGALRLGVVVDEVSGALAHASRHLATLALDVSLQFVAILVVMDVACYHKGLSLALCARLAFFLFLNGQLLQEMGHSLEVFVVVEPFDEACALLRTDAVDAGKLVIEE